MHAYIYASMQQWISWASASTATASFNYAAAAKFYSAVVARFYAATAARFYVAASRFRIGTL
jgi:hypothetical protein